MGSYTGSASPYGTFDQGGNVFQWNEAMIDVSFCPACTPFHNRGQRGGAYGYEASSLAASSRSNVGPSVEDSNIGFRLAMIPEPSTGLLVIAGLLGLAGWRRAHT